MRPDSLSSKAIERTLRMRNAKWVFDGEPLVSLIRTALWWRESLHSGPSSSLHAQIDVIFSREEGHKQRRRSRVGIFSAQSVMQQRIGTFTVIGWNRVIRPGDSHSVVSGWRTIEHRVGGQLECAIPLCHRDRASTRRTCFNNWKERDTGFRSQLVVNEQSPLHPKCRCRR